MPVWEQIPGSLGSHCCRQPSGIKDAALWRFSLLNQSYSSRFYFYNGLSNCCSQRLRLIANIKHTFYHINHCQGESPLPTLHRSQILPSSILVPSFLSHLHHIYMLQMPPFCVPQIQQPPR